MGMDLTGLSPKSKRGESFRNNWWYWRPTWNLVYNQCRDLLSEKDYEHGCHNDDFKITAQQAERIATRLLALCANGKVLDIEREYKRSLDALPDEICDICGGTGRRTDMIVVDGCNKCKGKKTVRPSATYYTLNAENVLEFAEFCADSGGFTFG